MLRANCVLSSLLFVIAVAVGSLTFAPALQAGEPVVWRVVDVPYTSDLMFVDGYLDEAAWEEAAVIRIGPTSGENSYNNPSGGCQGNILDKKVSWTVRLLHDEANVYISVETNDDYIAAAAAEVAPVFSDGLIEFTIKWADQSAGPPFRLTWLSAEPGAGPGVNPSSMWQWVGEWAYSLIGTSAANDDLPDQGYILEASVPLRELKYDVTQVIKNGEILPFRLMIGDFDGPPGTNPNLAPARWARYLLGDTWNDDLTHFEWGMRLLP